jgi:hypothetical protein
MFRWMALAVLAGMVCLPLVAVKAGQQEKERQDNAYRAEVESGAKTIPPGSKLYIAPMDNGFETYLAAGFVKKNVPVIITMREDAADFTVSGISRSDRAGWAKMLFLGTDASNDAASVKITNRKTGVVAFAYAVQKGSSYKGPQSAAEACAKHLKEYIEKGK